jgi:hypothetical protein
MQWNAITSDFLRQISLWKFLIALVLLMTLTGEVSVRDGIPNTVTPNHTSKIYRAHPRR